MHIQILKEPFKARWFNIKTKTSHDFDAHAAVVLTDDEYTALWEKLNHEIGSWMHERDKPYDVWRIHRTENKMIYFATEEDAILYRLSVT